MKIRVAFVDIASSQYCYIIILRLYNITSSQLRNALFTIILCILIKIDICEFVEIKTCLGILNDAINLLYTIVF